MASKRIINTALMVLWNVMDWYQKAVSEDDEVKKHRKNVQYNLTPVLEAVETIKELGVWKDPEFRACWASKYEHCGTPENWEIRLAKLCEEYEVALPPAVKTGREFI